MEIMLPNDNKKLIDLVIKNKFESESWIKSSGYSDEWQSWNDLYRNIPKGKPYTWMSNKFYPMVMSKCEASVSNLTAVLTASNPPFEVRPRENSDQMQARVIQQLLQYQFEESDFYVEFVNFLRCLSTFGTAVGKIYWDVKVDDSRKWEQQSSPLTSIFGNIVGSLMGGIAPTDNNVIKTGMPKFITCNLSDIFPDPTAIGIQDSWVIHRTRRSKDYLVNMHTNYPETYNEEVLKIQDADATEANESLTDDVYTNLARQTDPLVSRQKNEGGIELYERWGLVEKDGKLVHSVVTIAAGKYLIRNTENPYWHKKNPFVKGVYVPALNEFYGIGIPEILEDLQNNLNEIVNQRNDNISLALNKPAFYKRHSGVDTSKLIFKPGGLYGTDDDIPNTIQFVDVPPVTRDAFVQTQEIERWAQEVSGVTKLTLGMSGSDTNDTATGMEILQRASSERFMTIAKLIENQVVKEIIKQYYQLDYQFIEQEEVIRVVGEQGVIWQKVPPEVVRKNYDFVPTGVFSMENKAKKALRLMQLYTIAKDNPALKTNELIKKMYHYLEIGDNPNELIREDGEMMEIMRVAQMMAMDMVQQQMAQANMQQPAKPKGAKTPGMSSPNSGQFNGMQTNAPGVPPIAPGITPGDRV